MKSNQQLMQEDKNRSDKISLLRIESGGYNDYSYPFELKQNNYKIHLNKPNNLKLTKDDLNVLILNELKEKHKFTWRYQNKPIQIKQITKRLIKYIIVNGISLLPKEPEQPFERFTIK